MTLWYVVYTKDDCHTSVRTKELLQVMGADYYEEVLPQNDDWPTPLVFLEESYVGGYEDLRNHFYKRIDNVKKKKQKYRSA